MDKPYTDPILAEAQATLVDLLSRCSTVAEIHSELENIDLPTDLRDWLLTSNPDMLETAAMLTKKWGSKNPDHGVGTTTPPAP